MEKVILDFLKKERISVLTTMMDHDSPHAAALHFSYSEAKNCFYFSTERSSRKARFLEKTHTTNGALVIGFSEKEWLTFQLEGIVQIAASEEEIKEVKETHYAKFPESKKWENDPETIFLIFKPKWYRFTDFNKEPLFVVESKEE